MIYLRLFYEFFLIGLFAVGGGMATIPFLYDLADRYNWFTHVDVANMIAISESTPGPIGINMATYVGFTSAGVLGSVLATLALALPEVIIVLILFKFLERFKTNFYVESAFYGIRPVVTALISVACLEVLKTCVVTLDSFLVSGSYMRLIDPFAAALFVLMTFLVFKFKKHPVIYISVGAVCGVIMGYLK